MIVVQQNHTHYTRIYRVHQKRRSIEKLFRSFLNFLTYYVNPLLLF